MSKEASNQGERSPQRSHDRKERRAPICLLVEQIGKNQMYFDKSRDLSVEGMFIETEAPANLGERLQLRFALPGNFPMTLTGCVTRVIPKRRFIFRNKQPGMGIHFLEMDPAARQLLEEFLKAA